MPLSLIAGPANAGKVESLLDRYLAALEREPMLIVPNRSDVERVERELLARRPALLAGSIGTFDDVFERIAYAGGDARALVSQAQRALLVRRVLAGAELDRLAASARFGGFADSLQQALSELESGLIDPEQLPYNQQFTYHVRAQFDDLTLSAWSDPLTRPIATVTTS